MAYHKVDVEFNGQPLTIETGKMARQADGSVIIPPALAPYMGGLTTLEPTG